MISCLLHIHVHVQGILSVVVSYIIEFHETVEHDTLHYYIDIVFLFIFTPFLNPTILCAHLHLHV